MTAKISAANLSHTLRGCSCELHTDGQIIQGKLVALQDAKNVHPSGYTLVLQVDNPDSTVKLQSCSLPMLTDGPKERMDQLGTFDYHFGTTRLVVTLGPIG